MTNLIKEIRNTTTIWAHKETRIRLAQIQSLILVKEKRKDGYSRILDDMSIKYLKSLRRKYK